MRARVIVTLFLCGLCMVSLLSPSAVRAEEVAPQLAVRQLGEEWSSERVTTECSGGGTWLEIALGDQGGLTFSEDDAEVTPHDDYNVTFTLIGAALTYGAGGPNMPVTCDITIGDQTYDPWGNVNDGENPRTWTPDESFAAETAISARSTCYYPWYPYYQYRSVYSGSSAGYRVYILGDGETFPDVPGFAGQESVEGFLGPYIDEEDRMDIGEFDVVFLFEHTSDMNGPSADHQDMVLMASFQAAEAQTTTDFRFSGPDQTEKWNYTYYRSGVEVPNEFDLQLGAGEGDIVQVKVDPLGWPGTYAYPDFSLTRIADGATAEAGANVVIPANLYFPNSGTGQDTMLGGGESSTWETDQLDAFEFSIRRCEACLVPVRLQNVEDATVQYLLRAESRSDEPVVVKIYLGDVDITDQMFSEEGYATDALSPYEALDLTVKVVPVGSGEEMRHIVLSNSILRIYTPDLSQTEGFTVEDAVKSGVSTDGNKIRLRSWEQVD